MRGTKYLLFFVFLHFVFADICNAGFLRYGKHTLRGIKKVSVVIDSLSGDEAEAAGIAYTLKLTREQIKDDVELKLKSANIFIADSMPFLFVDCDIIPVKSEGTTVGVVASISVSFRQGVFLLSSGDITHSPTWDKATVGIYEVNTAGKQIRDIVKGFVDEFLKDFYEVNPAGRDAKKKVK